MTIENPWTKTTHGTTPRRSELNPTDFYRTSPEPPNAPTRHFIPLLSASPSPAAMLQTAWSAEEIPASARVFNIGELCEAVLLFVSAPADIVRCRRVNRKCLEVITHSKSLRRRLYLEDDTAAAAGIAPQGPSTVNPLPPPFFQRLLEGYRDSTIAARIDLQDLWTAATTRSVVPLWYNMLIAHPPQKSCSIPVGDVMTIYFRRTYPNGMTFGDLEKAVIAAFEIRKGRRSSQERLEDLSARNAVLIYRN